ncbi:MAG: pilin [Betaproteobacteria bacterium]
MCGTPVTVGGIVDSTEATGFLDTIHLQPGEGEPDDEPVVRPALAILFRIAVGPAADHYAPRFLEYERTGRSFPSWNWAAPWVPTVWAFYHKLWEAGLAFALWPVAAMAMFGVVDPYLGDSALASLACAVLLLWVVPGIVAALTADTLLYRKTRSLVREAEAQTVRPEETARLLGERTPIALGSAVFLGAVAMLSSMMVAMPELQTAVADRVVRTRVTEALASLHPLQRQIEEAWGFARSSLIAPNAETVGPQRGTELAGSVTVNLDSGRVRLALGPSIPELTGRSILLAPSIDRQERVRWICVPVDIPARYLPHECRQT